MDGMFTRKSWWYKVTGNELTKWSRFNAKGKSRDSIWSLPEFQAALRAAFRAPFVKYTALYEVYRCRQLITSAQSSPELWTLSTKI